MTEQELLEIGIKHVNNLIDSYMERSFTNAEALHIVNSLIYSMGILEVKLKILMINKV